MSKRISAGVLVFQGARLLLCHSTNTPHWDLPKGTLDPGESPSSGALRELREETSLVFQVTDLEDVGLHPYAEKKDLHLFLLHPRHARKIDPAELFCESMVTQNGLLPPFPEMDAFAFFDREVALSVTNLALAHLLLQHWAAWAPAPFPQQEREFSF